MLYRARQNNSGGSFKGPAIIVYLEADSLKGAYANAKSIGLDVMADNAFSCECCGDRWYFSKAEMDELELDRTSDISPIARKPGIPKMLVVYRNGLHEIIR